MISHLGFLIGGGDGDGDSGVSRAPIYMYVLEVGTYKVFMYDSTHAYMQRHCTHVHTPHLCTYQLRHCLSVA